MKIENKVEDAPITIGETNVKQATISSGDMYKLQYMLTKGLYADSVTAVIAEICNNGIDSVVESGKDPVENPVIVEIGTNDSGTHFFRVTDKGIGLSKDNFENIVMCYLKSTKQNSDDQIGMWGIGAKSFLSLERGATFVCRKDGVECKYYAYQGAEFCEYDLIHETPTTEPDGVIFEIKIEDWSEKNQFVSKAKQKLAYYDTVALLIDKQLIDSTIFREENFQWSTLSSTSKLHLCLKDVYYILDFDKLGIDQINVPIALRFGLKDGLVVTPSREALIYNEKVKEIIKKKIANVADYLVEKYNDQVENFDSFLDAYPHLNNDKKSVTISDKEFTINSITKFSSHKLKDIHIKDISLKTGSFYKANMNLFDNFVSYVGHYPEGWKNKYTTKRINQWLNNVISKRPNMVYVLDSPRGNVKEFLKSKYGKNTYFFKTDVREDLKWYKRELSLRKHLKKDWRGIIEEFHSIAQTMIDSLSVDETGVLSSQEYLDFLEVKRANRKKSTGGGGKYNILNKQQGDITLSYCRQAVRGNSVVFEKKACKINELHKKPHLTVYFEDTDKEIAEKYANILFNAKVCVCLIGKREISKLPDIHNFKTIEQFMSRDCKPFMRIASAILFTKVIEGFETISSSNMEVFENCLTSYIDDYNKIKKYVDKNYKGTDSDVEEAILKVAENKDLFDKLLWDVYLRLKEGIKKFDFITCFQEPDEWDEDAVKKYSRVINQMLLFQKKYHGLDGYEIVKSPQPDLTEEKSSEEGEEDEEKEFDIKGEIVEKDFAKEEFEPF